LSSTISIQELLEICHAGQKCEIVDVRSETEFAAGHIPGAKCIPLQQFPFRHADLGDGDIVLVCEAGTRASMAHKNLTQQRSGKVFVLDGGMRAWRKAGLPVVAPLGTNWSLERQVRLGAGVLILIGILLTVVVNEAWIIVPTFIGAGLTFAGTTNICMMGNLLARMPWNQLRKTNARPICSC
jgi:rhodanese-related sulfurtransferase